MKSFFQSTPRRSVSNKRKYSCEFLSDVTYPDSKRVCSVAPGATVLKVWNLKNAGTVPWSKRDPPQVFATRYDFEIEFQASFSPANVAPAECTELTITFTAPKAVGTYKCWFQLCDSERGTYFGQSLWVLFRVQTGGRRPLKCPKGHWMQLRESGKDKPLPPKYRKTYPFVNCDSCESKRINEKPTFHHCHTCAYDVCYTCGRKQSLENSKLEARAKPSSYSDGSYEGKLHSGVEKGISQRAQKTRKPVKGLVDIFHAAESVKEAFCATETDFYYYGCDGEEDAGWGCTYRVMQMMLSCLKYRLHGEHSTDKPIQIPSLLAIQKVLSEAEVFKSSIVGTKKWLEPRHGTIYFNLMHSQNTFGMDYVIDSKSELHLAWLVEVLYLHFGKDGERTPVMADDYIKTKAILGIGRCVSTNEDLILVFDPHVWSRTQNFSKTKFQPASHHDMRNFPAKAKTGRKWVSWQSFADFFGLEESGKAWMLGFLTMKCNGSNSIMSAPPPVSTPGPIKGKPKGYDDKKQESSEASRQAASSEDLDWVPVL